ncbi:MAG TPA: hypothetical protein VFW33_21500 [Gemmataceae bacterium]|nr:hypothetical protein [Gemmataceae bacterium]
MDSPANRRSAVQRQLDAYEESWKQDHQAAMACRDWEDTVLVGISLFRLMREREETWRERVFRGSQEYAEAHNESVQSFYRDWLRMTDDLLTRLPALEKQFGTVEHADELRRCAEGVRKLLASWTAPRLSRAVGLREMALSPEAAAQLNTLLDRAGGADTPPTRPLRRVPPADPAFVDSLKKKSTS